MKTHRPTAETTGQAGNWQTVPTRGAAQGWPVPGADDAPVHRTSSRLLHQTGWRGRTLQLPRLILARDGRAHHKPRNPLRQIITIVPSARHEKHVSTAWSFLDTFT